MDFVRRSGEREPKPDDLSSALRSMGYSEHEISTAYSWFLEKLDDTPEKCFSSFPGAHNSNRILTVWERMRISPKAYGFLIKILNMSLINDEQLEAILERTAAFEVESITLDQMKLIASSIVFDNLNEFETLPIFDSRNDQSHLVN